MLNLEEVVTAVKNQVRFKQTVNPDIPELVDDLVTPSSARLVDHALLTNEILDAIAPDFDNWDYPDWDAGTVYNPGDRVRFEDNIWECNTLTVAGESPETTPAKWDIIAGLSGYLEEKRDEAVRNVVTTVYNQKKNDRVTKEMIDHLTLFNGVGRLNDRIVKKSRFVGWELRMLDQLNIKTILESIGIQLDADDTFDLYLYHTTQVNPLATINVPYTGGGSVEWLELTADNILQYESFDSPELVGGSYYLGYYEDDLTAQAINYRYDFQGGIGCRSCSRYNKDQYTKWSQFVWIRPIRVAQSDLNEPGRELWDIAKTQRDENTNYGLNIRLTTYCDLTDYFVRHPEVFTDAVARQLTVDLLRELSNNIRNNLISENVQDKARFALQDTSLGGEGELKRLNKSLDALGYEFSDIQNSNCMPRINSEGSDATDVIGNANNGLNYNRGFAGYKKHRNTRHY